MERPRAYRLARGLARWASGILARGGREIRWLPPPLHRWTRTRDFPVFPIKSFRAIWALRSRRRKRDRHQ
jgi:L-lactate dehydrogenase complex protein LldF